MHRPGQVVIGIQVVVGLKLPFQYMPQQGHCFNRLVGITIALHQVVGNDRIVWLYSPYRVKYKYAVCARG